MDTLGIDVGASVSDNTQTFKRMTNETKAFKYDEVVVWFQALSKKSECTGLSDCAEEYAQKLVEDEEKNQGWLWLDEPQEYWSFMKSTHHKVLEREGFDRGIIQLPIVGTPAQVPANVSRLTPGNASYGYSLPTPPVANGTEGITAAMEGFKWRHPSDLPLSGSAVARAAAVNAVNHAATPQPHPMSTVTGVTEASAITQAIVAGMTTWTEQQKEDRKSQLSLTEAEKFDKPVPGIMTLEPDKGSQIKVSAFLAWLKSIEEAWGKVSAQVQQVIAKIASGIMT